MLTDGEKLKSLFQKAKERVVICSPYIKISALRSVLSYIPSGVQIEIYTRLKAADIYMGASDLEVFYLCQDLENCTIKEIKNLHAKLYSADELVLVGSANLTNSALGWVNQPNIEILCSTTWSEPSVLRLNYFMSAAHEISQEDLLKIKSVVDGLEDESAINEIRSAEADSSSNNKIWLPKSSVPQLLYRVYIDDTGLSYYTKSVIQDAIDDISDLRIPCGLSKQEFYNYVEIQLQDLVVFREIIEEIPRKIVEHQGLNIIRKLDPSLNNTDLRLHWNNIILWIIEFLGDEFEAVPSSFELRLKS